MPELPDITLYIERLEERVLGSVLEGVRLASPFLLRSVEPPLEAAAGRKVAGLRRLGKRIALGLEGDLHLVLHLMISGRLRWKERGARPPGRQGLAAFDFSTGTLLLTEAAKKKRASLHVVQGRKALEALDPGGLEVMDASREAFQDALLRENRTLKRALTDPRLFSGIGNAYSDEILHAARLSPVARTRRLTGDEIARLHESVRRVLGAWIERLRREAPGRFPGKVTAFRPEMAVHGRYGKPCPDCGSPVQRIVYAGSESNYCAACQNDGRLLADRALSRLLKGDWPRTLAELEEREAARRGGSSGG